MQAKRAILHHDTPENLEKMRIEEVRKLSYKERYERLIKLIELSYYFQKAKESKNKD